MTRVAYCKPPSNLMIRSISLFLLLAQAIVGQAQRARDISDLTPDRLSKIVERVRARPPSAEILEEAIEIGFNLLRTGRYGEGLSLFTAVREANRGDNRVMYGSA